MNITNSKLAGKKVVVLGGTSGFGFATARSAAAADAQVVIASRNQGNVDKAIAQLSTGVTGATLDITDESSLQDFFDDLGALDHLVITAGDTAPAFNPTIQQARQAFEVRFWGLYCAVQAAVPHIQPGGSITLTNGIVALRPWKGWALTSAIAGAVESFTRGLALDLAPIRVNAVCAGVVKTPLWSGMTEAEREALFADTASKLPVGRVGEPEDIAETYLYLMQSQFTTGQIIIIDGGAAIA
jgi:NAD(P)-dependent dehydrogenase (short-subunit alcohol dehydrogenase family)